MWADHKRAASRKEGTSAGTKQTRQRQRGVAADILAHVALGGGVEGGELHVAGVLMPHLVKHFLKGVESAVRRVHVVLVYLQGTHGSGNESFWKA